MLNFYGLDVVVMGDQVDGHCTTLDTNNLSVINQHMDACMTVLSREFGVDLARLG